METKEIIARLDIVKIATTIGDYETIKIQTEYFNSTKSSRLHEISNLLNGKNYRQALYLIKSYLADMGNTESYSSVVDLESDGEKVLDIEDMLRMSPLAKETIKDYKRSIYTEDDLASFTKSIDNSLTDKSELSKKSKAVYDNSSSVRYDVEYEDENEIESSEIKEDENFVENIVTQEKEKSKEKIVSNDEDDINLDENSSKELDDALDSASDDTPLDEISSEVVSSTKKKRNKVLSKYKTLRGKFAKKEVASNTKKEEIVVNKTEDSIEEEKFDSNLTEEENRFNNNLKEEAEIAKEATKVDNSNTEETKVPDDIYPAIYEIEEKYRQSFVLYPPVKESEVWTQEVVDFLKHIAKNSFSEKEVRDFMQEYDFFIEKKDISKAAQVLLLASATDSNYAKFILARELFTGKIINRDLKKSFLLMKELANKFYPEAICDLGQFYEYGIGVSKDEKVAIKLYEKAFELGVNRATKHIDKLKESGGILSSFFKLKLGS